ncbi:DUF4752 family protein [Morganella psychrotolerans]|uniref:DUF4752 family protein n=1 Tax=Morganella psychrotolerans TaxID=368603 RepID=A0A1B8HTE3_9GAMM|nr:DUF4752 family protein [Morganella psychrotolerans]OBU13036.1 hypothetical protein AYY18_14350 [Morganella psychrotolerans]
MDGEITTWLTVGLNLIGYLWVITKSIEWFFCRVLFRKTFGRKNKDRKQAAVNELYDAYDLGEIKQGGDMKITTKNGLVILMYRQSKE